MCMGERRWHAERLASLMCTLVATVRSYGSWCFGSTAEGDSEGNRRDRSAKMNLSNWNGCWK